jgi:hypothetical protein
VAHQGYYNLFFNGLGFILNFAFPLLIVPIVVSKISMDEYNKYLYGLSVVTFVTSIMELGLGTLAVKYFIDNSGVKINGYLQLRIILFFFIFIGFFFLRKIVGLEGIFFLVGQVLYDQFFLSAYFYAKNKIHILFFFNAIQKCIFIVAILNVPILTFHNIAVAHSISMFVITSMSWWWSDLNLKGLLRVFNTYSVFADLKFTVLSKSLDGAFFPMLSIIFVRINGTGGLFMFDIGVKFSKIITSLSSVVINSIMSVKYALSISKLRLLFTAQLLFGLTVICVLYNCWPIVVSKLFDIGRVEMSDYNLMILILSVLISLNWFLGDTMLILNGYLQTYLRTSLFKFIGFGMICLGMVEEVMSFNYILLLVIVFFFFELLHKIFVTRIFYAS